jgi:starch phosphorylase
VNGVALKHGEVSRAMFPGVDVRSITNGVHAATWACPSFQRLFDHHAPGWRLDNSALRNMVGAGVEEVWTAHLEAKQNLVDLLKTQGHDGFDRDALTLVWARRATGYKRPQLLFESLDRLKSMTRYIGPLQIIFAGKAHPRDEEGKALIRSIHEIAGQLRGRVPVAYIENYDMKVAQTLVAGADVWVNTPRPPMEASGTSGMKAAMNGVPSLSVLDGWWIEGHIEGATGWAVGEYVADAENPENDRKVAHALYEKLAKVVLPCYFKDRNEFIAIMRRTVAFSGSFFNTHRMVEEYLVDAYGLEGGWRLRGA